MCKHFPVFLVWLECSISTKKLIDTEDFNLNCHGINTSHLGQKKLHESTVEFLQCLEKNHNRVYFNKVLPRFFPFLNKALHVYIWMGKILKFNVEVKCSAFFLKRCFRTCTSFKGFQNFSGSHIISLRQKNVIKVIALFKFLKQ